MLRHLHRSRLNDGSITSPHVGSSPPSTPATTVFGDTASAPLSPSSSAGTSSSPFSFRCSPSFSTRSLLPISSADIADMAAAQGAEGFFNRESLFFATACICLLGMATLGPAITRGWPVFFIACYTLLVLSGVILMGAGVLATKTFTSVASRVSLIISILLLELPVLSSLGGVILRSQLHLPMLLLSSSGSNNLIVHQQASETT
ncbi:unnamed protein product [Urochloa humidicola]